MVDMYNKNVFTEENLQKGLSKEDYEKYRNIVKNEATLDKEIAQKIADVMKKWAIERGATHYSHWFQPLSGKTAEKQTSFLSIDSNNNPIIEFSASALITGEIDASSFPNGGLRSIFEARGLTKWDYTYPAFLKESSNGTVFCIPTILQMMDGTSLDKRMPLLKSCEVLNKEVLRILRLFGDNEIQETSSVLGSEQEYFLIKKELFDKRKDLLLTGKTLLGRELIGTPRTHYMSSLSEKNDKFMTNVEKTLWKLGVPAQVKHNEVAPRQYEMVPHFEDIKYAANHDFLMMEVLENEAKKVGTVCLLDEKPFRGINGSGKHNNWSINTKEGKPLFSYGDNAVENARFITFIVATITALDKHSDLIRATVASNNNDNRLSGFEAPSSIVSIYLGKELTDVFEELVNDKDNKIKLGETKLSLSQLNITDRNRTSPFAFLGKRFEFRMPGSSSSVTVCNTVINTVMAEALSEIADALEKSKDFYSDLKKLVVEKYKEHSRIIYNGNSYSDEWEEEAKRRGLRNIKTAPEAYKAFVTEESIKMFEKFNVYSTEELKSRYSIKLGKYAKSVEIEAKVMLEMVKQDIMPKVLEYANYLKDSSEKLNDLKYLKEELEKVIALMNNAHKEIKELEKRVDKLKVIENLEEKARYCSKELKEQMHQLRGYVDTLEGILPLDYWPIPTYSDLLN